MWGLEPPFVSAWTENVVLSGLKFATIHRFLRQIDREILSVPTECDIIGGLNVQMCLSFMFRTVCGRYYIADNDVFSCNSVFQCISLLLSMRISCVLSAALAQQISIDVENFQQQRPKPHCGWAYTKFYQTVPANPSP